VALGEQVGEDVGLGFGQGRIRAGPGGGQGAADGVQGGGEGDPVRVDPGACRCQADDGADGLVDDQVSPQFLAGQVRGAAAQDPAGAAQVSLEFPESGLNWPLLIPVKR
jgi:hypothetical protein